jgi:DNA-binding LacI/PurR family transcriptional regulator
MTNSRRITITQIAREAGVSKQTVSRVLNDRPDVAPETRQRVQSIIDRKGYRPSNLARGLTQGRSFTIGVISSGIHQFGPSQILAGIEVQTRSLGYTLYLNIIDVVDDATVTSALSNMLAQQVDGVVWSSMPRVHNSHHPLKLELQELGIPVVVIGTEVDDAMSVVMIDNCLGGKQATQHLLEQGYHTIGIITGDLDEWSARQRLRGWQESLAAAGLFADPCLIFEGDWSAASGARGLHQLLAQRPEIDAIFASNDQMALGVLSMAHELRRQIPQELGVVGFDDIPEANYSIPPLTTVHQDLFQSGRLAVKELERQIGATIRDAPYETRATTISTELIVRASSGRVSLTHEREAKGELILA